jgi:hypothetical protein
MFSSLVQRAMRIGFRRGMSGARGWLIIGIAAAGVRTLGRLSRDEEQVLYRTVVKAGDVFEIVTSSPKK